MMVRRAGYIGFAALVWVMWSCGGKVVIVPDEMDAGDTGGSSGVVCSWPDPAGSLGFCGGSSSGGDCSTVYCDVNGNTYEAACSGSSCQCLYNGQVSCTCASNGGDDYCAAGVPTCCPFPSP